MIQDRLFAMQDLAYREFNSRLIPTVDAKRIIGVRTPALRSFAKEIAGTGEAQSLLKKLPHDYYEEDNLHALLLEGMGDFDACVAALDAFLPYVDNWATCDMLSPKVFKTRRDALLSHVRRWLDSGHVYTVRFGIDMLMKHYLGDAFREEYSDWVCGVRTDEYYLMMAVAWYFATALTVRYEETLPFIMESRLDLRTHNKAIQKACESLRISPERKAALKKLRR